MRLGVNIDHVATLRQVRRAKEPSAVFAGLIAWQAGADLITLHVREDRRHVQEEDLELLCRLVGFVNLEMAPREEMIEMALRHRPRRATLVPERREELTTEGGLDVKNLSKELERVLRALKEGGLEVCAFIEPDVSQVERARELGFDAVELHTGNFANLFAIGDFKGVEREIESLTLAAKRAKELNLSLYAGHGLNLKNLKLFVDKFKGLVEEVNIGHSIVSNAVIFGFERSVSEFLKILRSDRCD
ncbi:MAG: pyridoxine 5'-phosphate synthase [Aquificaceae bacterium]